jgi:hypothetical protein
MSAADHRADDLSAVLAIATLAVCTSAITHEALGHGVACLAAGGHIELLSNAFFRCSNEGRFIAIAGPLANVFASFLVWQAQGVVHTHRPALRLYCLLVFAFCSYWEAGYLIAAMVQDKGDMVFAWRALIGQEAVWVRAAGVAIGLLAYVQIGRLLSRGTASFAQTPLRLQRLLRPAWLTGLAVMIFAAAFYPADRVGAMRDAALSVVASFPLWFTRIRLPTNGAAADTIARDRRLTILAALLGLAFVMTMGRGLT